VKIAIGLYVVYNATATLVSIPGGRHGDRRGLVRVFAAGVGCFALAYAAFAIDSTSIAFLAGAFAIAGVGIGLVETAEHAAVATFAPDEIRGSAFGLLAAIQSFGNLAASAIVGVIYTAVSATAAFTYASTLMVIALVTIAVTSSRSRRAT
jgi:MFS family permease